MGPQKVLPPSSPRCCFLVDSGSAVNKLSGARREDEALPEVLMVKPPFTRQSHPSLVLLTHLTMWDPPTAQLQGSQKHRD